MCISVLALGTCFVFSITGIILDIYLRSAFVSLLGQTISFLTLVSSSVAILYA